MINCKEHRLCKLLYAKKGRHVRLHDVYRVYLSTREGQEIWIVNGDKVFRRLYPAYIMGGNDQRYRFNPPDEVWIDNRISVEELKYTIAHELIERKLMRERGWTYDRAHKSGIALEKVMRDRDLLQAARHERALKRAGWPIPEGVYRQFYCTRQGLKVWIVDGPTVRRELDGDFCFGGHGLKYRFVPKNEIWLDSAMTVEQIKFALLQELTERKLMASGWKYNRAYEQALVVQLDERERQECLARKHEAKLAPVRYGTRERGVKAGS